MYRKITTFLENWKEDPHRKPLILQGARQVGKTYSLLEFGRTHYENTAYFNFETNPALSDTFAGNISPAHLLPILSHIAGTTIIREKTLIIFDEIQLCERALTSLKYFYEDAPWYHIVCAGSLLGIALHEGTSFPVGKVDFLSLYPLSFREFLMATAGERFARLLESRDYPIITSFKQTYVDALRQYYFVGGMPEAVQSFAEEKDFNQIREIQKRILAAYEQDFSNTPPLKSCQKSA